MSIIGLFINLSRYLFIYLIITNLSFSSVCSSNSLKDENFNIPQAVTVALSNQGFNTIKDDLITILSTNGIDLSRFLIQETNHTMDKTSTEKLVNDPAVQNTIIKIKSILENHFDNFKINPHKFSLEIRKILVLAQWKSIVLNIHPFKHDSKDVDRNQSDLFKADLVLEAKNIKLSADSFSITDLENAWLSKWGINKLKLEMTEKSKPLKITINTLFYKKEDDTLAVKVTGIDSNIEQTPLDFGDNFTLEIPKMGFFIEDKKYYIKTDQIKKDLLSIEKTVIATIQEAVNKNIKTLVPTLLTDYIAKVLATDMTEINQMSPPGAPSTGKVNPLIWGIKLIKFSADNGLFSLQFNGLVEDPAPKVEEIVNDNNKKKIGKSHPLNTREVCLDDYKSQETMTKYQKMIDQYDVSFGFKTDFFNKFISISFLRGYIKEISLSDGDKIILIEQPILYVDAQNQLRMRIGFTNHVKGIIESYAVKNPIVMSMDLILDTPIDPKTHKVTLVVKDIDMESVIVSEDNFRWPFKSKGVKSAKDKVAKARKSSAGYVLSDELPIPTDLMGILLETKASSYDKNGYMIFHSNYK